MRSLYLANVTVHVLAALLWLGGMLFLAVVGAPVLRKLEPPRLRAEIFRQLGARFRTVGWITIGVLLATGVLNLHFSGALYRLGDASMWGTRYGHALAWKLVAVAVMVGASALHDFVLGPRAARLPPGSPAGIAARKRASWIARINALVAVLLVIAAVRLARGG